MNKVISTAIISAFVALSGATSFATTTCKALSHIDPQFTQFDPNTVSRLPNQAFSTILPHSSEAESCPSNAFKNGNKCYMAWNMGTSSFMNFGITAGIYVAAPTALQAFDIANQPNQTTLLSKPAASVYIPRFDMKACQTQNSNITIIYATDSIPNQNN